MTHVRPSVQLWASRFSPLSGPPFVGAVSPFQAIVASKTPSVVGRTRQTAATAPSTRMPSGSASAGRVSSSSTWPPSADHTNTTRLPSVQAVASWSASTRPSRVPVRRRAPAGVRNSGRASGERCGDSTSSVASHRTRRARSSWPSRPRARFQRQAIDRKCHPSTAAIIVRQPATGNS
jgi:hypothetical protein